MNISASIAIDDKRQIIKSDLIKNDSQLKYA